MPQERVRIFLSAALRRTARTACLRVVRDSLEKQLLKGVSRSFYLTLRLLPAPMRGAASLAYLLARTSDTLADASGAQVEARMLCLDWFARSLSGEEEPPRWPIPVLNKIHDPAERLLMEASGDLLQWLNRLPSGEAALVREVVEIIISGQRLDLERFGEADKENPVALADDPALEDYAWRVAGCVGAFWTKLGFFTLGNRFSDENEARLLERGIAYGKGLQLVNILRDLPADLAAGRCYLPVADPRDMTVLLETHQRWVERAMEWVSEGFHYARTLQSRRLEAATVLPAMLARETLERLRGVDWQTLETRVKVPRSKVYQSLARALWGDVS